MNPKTPSGPQDKRELSFTSSTGSWTSSLVTFRPSSSVGLTGRTGRRDNRLRTQTRCGRCHRPPHGPRRSTEDLGLGYESVCFTEGTPFVGRVKASPNRALGTVKGVGVGQTRKGQGRARGVRRGRRLKRRLGDGGNSESGTHSVVERCKGSIVTVRVGVVPGPWAPVQPLPHTRVTRVVSSESTLTRPMSFRHEGCDLEKGPRENVM